MACKVQRTKQLIIISLVVMIPLIIYWRNIPPSVIQKEDITKTTNVVNAIESIRSDCGELCEVVALGEPGPYFDHIKVPIDCPALFKNEYIDRGHKFPNALHEIPRELYNDLTMNKRLDVTLSYFDQVYLGKTAKEPVWTEANIEQAIKQARHNKLTGNYGISETNALRDGLQHAPGVKNGRVLVIGSESPWVEACVLESGAREIVSLEYGNIKSEHPKVTTMTPGQFRNSYLTQTLKKFDAVVTFSSVEHSGLGRYGDALNPWGDIIAIARSWCVTEEGGSLTIGVMYDKELDYIKFNAGRWYGKIRYPYLTTNWKQHYRGNGIQRVHVFTKEKLDYTKPLQYYLKKPYPYHHVSNVDIKYSQARQDEVVYNIFQKKNGFFIDIGANDGELFSNSLWLERKHNWTGLLIEANPDLCRKMDILRRQAWRLCGCISDTLNKTKFIQSGTVGGMESEIDDHHMKQIKTTRTITVPCFNMNAALDEINVHHIDYFSLDVEGAERIVLNSMKNELSSGKMTVDVWSIEFRVYDGTRNIEQKSLENLEKLRTFFKEIGRYTEHSQVDNLKNNENNAALDVIFVNVKTWCKTQKKLPNGTECSEVIHI